MGFAHLSSTLAMFSAASQPRTGFGGSAGSDSSIEHFPPAAVTRARVDTRSRRKDPPAADVQNLTPAPLLPAPTDMVRFAVADVFCAIGLSQVDEVLAMPAVTPLPEVANHLLGAVDLHGTAVPVIDLHRLLGREPVGIRPDQHLLVLSGAGGRLAVRCDRVEGMVVRKA